MSLYDNAYHFQNSVIRRW